MSTASPSVAHALPFGSADPLFDDDIAATQQSILEELHTISEEALSANSDHSESHINSHIIDQSYGAETKGEHDGIHSDASSSGLSQLLMSRFASQQGAQLSIPASSEHNMEHSPAAPHIAERSGFEQEAPSPTPPIMADGSEITSQTADDGTNSNVVKITPLQADIEESVVTLESLPQRSDPQSATPLSSSILAPTQTLNTTPEPPDAAPSQMDASFELDHADLFDGIEPDAFDDIELSPPTRRHVALPLKEPPQSLAGLDSGLDSDEFINDESPQLPPGSQTMSFLQPCFVGFQTGHGKQVKLSDKALEKARKLMMQLDDTTDLLPPAQTSQSSLHKRIHTTGSLPQALQSFGNAPSMLSTVTRTPMQEIVPKQRTAAINESEKCALAEEDKVASVQATSQVTALPAAQAPTTRRIEPHPFTTPKQTRNGRLPVRQNLASPMRTPATAPGLRFTTPQPSKRISLGMLPRAEIGGSSSTGSKRTLPRFVTPFKGGKRPRTEDLQDLASPLRRLDRAQAQSLSRASPISPRQSFSMRQASSNISKGSAVFCMQHDGPRHKLAAVGRPEYYSSMQMIAKGVPDEVLVVLKDASQAARYAFEGPDSALLMQQQALEELHARGCSNADMPWVQNHWTLILWKLAAMVRLEPSSASNRWSWNELIRQLLYRYEREVNLAQRSCLKRIQEHDSSAARPMVLMVSKILEEEIEVQSPSGEIVSRICTILELSDGWYRILAQIDSVLTNACQRGRLRIGQKLAIMGATLDAHGEGKEVLSAYRMSNLVLTANSVSLAPWDAKLGFASTPFCASLRSLTPEGGLISLMDVVITKVYPLAYVDVDKSNAGAPRGEQEEAEQREAWLQRREDAMQQLELEAEAELGRLYDLVEALNDLVGDAFLPSIPDDPTGRLEAFANQLFDQLRAQPNPASAVKERVVTAGHTSLVPWLHNLAKSALLQEDGIRGSSLSAELDRLCPPRKVREFRVVKFRDARLPPQPPATCLSTKTQQVGGSGATSKRKNAYARAVQLTVRDAAQLGDELREGRRFLVTNLVPMSKSAWRKPDDQAEVFLSTRRDTKWRPVA